MLRILSFLNNLKPVIANLLGISADAVYITGNQDMSDKIAHAISRMSCAVVITYVGGEASPNTSEQVCPPVIEMEFTVSVWTPAFRWDVTAQPVIDRGEQIISGLHGYKLPGTGAGGSLIPRYMRNEVEINVSERTGDQYLVDKVQFRARIQLAKVSFIQAD